MRSHMTDKNLFQPVRLGSLQLKNRLVMNPMTRSRADADGVVGEITVKYYAERASAGLIVTEGIAPSPNGRGYARIPGLWNQAQIDAWKPVTAAVHGAGGVIFAQLMHTGRVSHVANMPAGAKVVAPSAVPLSGTQMWTDAQGMQDYPVPEVLDETGIEQAKNEIVNASKNAIAAGFDGVELHGANGYLIEQFISPTTNQRTDRWGGSVENRLRFPIEVTRAVAAAIGGDKVGIRVSPHGLASGMVGYPEIDETYVALAKALAPLGLAYIHIADHAGQKSPELNALKAAIRKVWPGVILVGGSFEQASAERAVKEGVADLAGFGKAFLANPDLAKRFQKGLPLNAPDPSTFFTPGPKGYIDYPTAD